MIKTLKQALEQRYTTKVFDPTRPADEEKIEVLIETLRLAPSSFNSQPWHLFIITNADEKRRLAEAAWDHNKPKFKDGSHLFLFCAKTDFGEVQAREIEERVAEVRGVPVNEERVAMMAGYMGKMSPAERQEWMRRQVYLMFGQFLLSCALLELDACPVEGFVPDTLDALLGLPERGLTAVVAGVVGQRSADDFNTLEKAAKVRFPRERVVTEIN